MTKIIPYIVIAILMVMLLATCSKVSDLENENRSQLRALGDSIEHWQNSNGENVTRVKILQINNARQLDELASNRQSFVLVQAELRRLRIKMKKGGSVTYINTTTTIKDPADTIYVNMDSKGNPLYTDSLSRFGKWITGTVMLGKDTSSYNMHIENEFVGSLYWKRDKGLKHLFQTKYPVFELTNKNPYTSTNDLLMTNIKQKPQSKWGIMIGAGISVDIKGEILPTMSMIFGRKIP